MTDAQQEHEPKSKLTVALLCLFLGWLGVHRFYVGKIGTGILMALTSGGVFIWWIIDLIMICCNQFRDKQGYMIGNESAGVATRKEMNQANLEKLKEQNAVIEESLITTGYPPQNTPTVIVGFLQMVLFGILLSPIGMFIIVSTTKSNTTKQQNRVKEMRAQRGITLPPEAYAASEAYFDKQRAECNKAIFPSIIAWVILFIIIIYAFLK